MNLNAAKNCFNYRMSLFEIFIIDINDGAVARWPSKNNFINFRDVNLETFLRLNPQTVKIKRYKREYK